MFLLKAFRPHNVPPRVQLNNLLISSKTVLKRHKPSIFSIQRISSIPSQEDFTNSLTLTTEWSELFSKYKSSNDSPESLHAAGKLISLLTQSKPTPFWKKEVASFYAELHKSNFQLGSERDYGGLIAAFNKLGMNQECEEVISTLKQRGHSLNTYIYNNYLELIGKKSSTKAFSIYKEMLKESIQPNIYTYNILLHSCKVHNNTSLLPKIIADMSEASIEKDLYTYSTLISICVNTAAYNKALGYYDEMLRKNVTPDAGVLTSMINLYTKSREASKATEIYHTMLDRKIVPDVVTFSSLISLYSNIGDIQKMKEVFQTMQENAVEPNVVVYSALIHAAAKHSGLNEAKALYKEMLERNISPNAVTLSVLANAYIKNNHLASALDLFNDALRKGCVPDTVLINNLIYGCAREDINLALPLYEQMKQAGVLPNLKTYSLLIGKGYTKLPLTTLIHFFQDMESYGIRPSPGIYYCLLGACRAQKNTTLADSLYLQMVKHEVKPTVHTIRILMELHSHSQNYNRALHYFKELEKWNLEPDSNICALAFKSYNHLGQHKEVMRLWNHIQLHGFSKESQLSFISSVIDSCGFASDREFLRDFWNYVKITYPLNSNHFSSYIEALCRLGDTEKAKKVFLEEMIRYGIAVDIKVCQTLITQLKSRGSSKDVVQIINFMMKYHPRLWVTLIKRYH